MIAKCPYCGRVLDNSEVAAMLSNIAIENRRGVPRTEDEKKNISHGQMKLPEEVRRERAKKAIEARWGRRK